MAEKRISPLVKKQGSFKELFLDKSETYSKINRNYIHISSTISKILVGIYRKQHNTQRMQILSIKTVLRLKSKSTEAII